MADTPEIKQEKQTTTAVEQTNEKIDKLDETIKKMSTGVVDAINKPPKKDTEGIQETKRSNKNILDTLKGIRDSFKVKLGEGAGGLMVIIKKVFKYLIRNFMKIVGFGMLGLLTLVDMKQLRELWIAFKDAFIAMYKVLAPIVAALWKWTNETLIPATVKGLIKAFGSLKTMFVSITENFEGWDKMDWSDKVMAVLKSFKSIGTFFADTGKILINWIGNLFGVKGDIFKIATKDEKKMKKEMELTFDNVWKAASDYAISLLSGLIGMFAIGKFFPLGWVGKMMKGPLRVLTGQSFFAPPEGAAGAKDAAAAGVDGKGVDKQTKKDVKGQKRIPKGKPGAGRYAATQKSLWSKVVKMFGKGARIFKGAIGRIAMSLMTMGPIGWGLLAALALGGIVFYYWDEISAGVEKAFQFMKDAVKDLKDIMKGVMGGAKKMAVNALRKIGLDDLANKLEDRPRTPPKESKAAKEWRESQQGMNIVDFAKKRKEETSWGLSIHGDETTEEIQTAYNEYQKDRLNIKAQKKKNEDIRKKLAVRELKSLKLVPDELLNVDISGTGQAGFDKLSADSKMKTNLLAKLLGGVRMTSGARDKDTGDEAMLWSKDGMRKYKKKWRDLLTEQGISLDSTPGSKERQQAIDALRKGGMTSQHEHGNAIDFSYPYPFSKKNFSGLKTTLLGAFPGATIIPESDHVHMSFDKNKSGMQVAQLQTETSQLNIAGNGQNGNAAGDVTSINTQVTNQSPSFSVNGKTPRNQVVENAKG